jgi:hypothetical protein
MNKKALKERNAAENTLILNGHAILKQTAIDLICPGTGLFAPCPASCPLL